MRRTRNAMHGRSGCDPAQIIRQSPQMEIVRYRKGDTGNIIETILWMDAHSAKWVNTDRVECLRGATEYETLHNVWAFVKKNLRYLADRPGFERVKSPGALYTSGVGDCKSFSIAEGALLRALGIPYKYRFAAYAPGDFTHVYIVAGDDVVMDAVHTRFDDEVRYQKKKDIRPTATAIGALPPAAPRQDWGMWLAGLIGIYLIFYK